MKDKEMNDVFKQELKLFVEEMFDSCEDFVNEIHNCSTYGELKDMMTDNSEFIVKKLNYYKSCESCSNKDDEIEELSDSVTDLSDDLECAESELKESFTPKSLDDAYKLEAFKNAKDNFSVSEIESMFM